MSNLPTFTGRKLIKILAKFGFEVVRTKGSHYFLKNIDDGRCTVIPVHKGETIGRGLLFQILRDVELTIEDIL
ncbi:hypothetical protein AGMMS49938_18450 [Fibrobacterales bacterium]|nr:hypothetical protein AGMMS49938_18450 [Fibrobacterales bacterium]